MSERPFVHLHCHSHYSLLDGASRIPELVAHAKGQGMNAIALTDHGNLYGALEFYREAKAAGINPIVGYEAYVAPTRRDDRSVKGRGGAAYHLTLLAKNRTGFKNLIKMSSAAFLEGYHYVPRIDKELLETHKDGLICLSGCASAQFSELILKEQWDRAKELCAWYVKLFGEKNFFIEVQNNGLSIQRRCYEGAVRIADEMGLPLVATSDAHYLCRDDAGAHDVLLCINTKSKRTDVKRLRYGEEGATTLVPEFYVRPPAEMYELFPKHPEAVKRSQEIADSVHLDIDFKKRYFPVFTPPNELTPEAYLRQLAQDGLKDRFGPDPRPEAVARLEHELGIICRMGFASYFLIVWDFVRHSREEGIPCSARGSGCAAVVSYVLKLSHIDPLEYDLLFERFLDPNRSEAPDIDIDFCQERREEVIQYVKHKYGESSVAQIATFGTMAAKAALTDVGRVLDVPLERVKQMTKLVPSRLNVTLDDALKEVPDFQREYDLDPQVKEWVDIARRLEGTNRNAGTHAAGVVIANGPITDYVPIHRVVRRDNESGAKTGEAVVTTQWVMGDLEKAGLLKMDFLGLRTLTLLENARRLIKKTRGIDIDCYALPLDDRATYELLQRGDAKGVFQFESEGIRELLKRLRPDNIRDIIACTALYRPGPLQGGLVDTYVNCKHGREKPVYLHPVMEEILAETYGVMVYQEEVMRILNRLGGIELSSAYACIKAISKKKHETIEARKVDFIAGAVERGLSEQQAREIFEQIVVFGGYGFNKCVVAETGITEATTGEQTTVGELFRSRRPFLIHALGADGALTPRSVSDVVWNGRKPVYKLRTRLGHTIAATANHPFRTFSGWTNLRDLKPGDRIATPRCLPIAGADSWPSHELIALAGLLAEGNTCHPTCLYFYNNDRALVTDFVSAVQQFPDTVARVTQRRRGIHEVCVSTGRDARYRAGHQPWNCSGAATVKVTPIRSGAYRWAKRLDILNRRATEKVVPEPIFRLCEADQELFLGRLWAGDGFIASANLFVPFYATSSAQLARDVQALLLRLGMVSRLDEKVFKYRGGERPGYTVRLLGESSVETFARRIATHCLGREKAVERLTEYLASTRRGQTSKDTIPAEVRSWVDEERQSAGLSWVDLEDRSGVCMREFLGKGSAVKVGFQRATLARLAEFFGSQRLRQLAASDVFWDEVVSIEPAGVQDTYDLTVDVDHNFVADGLIVHNSHSAAYAIISYHTAYLKANYTAEFMAALLSSEIDDGNKRDNLVDHIQDAKKMGVHVAGPNVNDGEADFAVTDGRILFGLTAIKGLGRGAAEEIVRGRHEQGAFRDLFDFCERVDLKIVQRAAIERVIKAGGMDCFGARRAQLMAALPRAIQAADELQNDRRRGQKSFFDVMDDGGVAATPTPVEVLPDVPEWPPAEKLKFEKEALDFYFSSHPLAQYERDIRRLVTHSVAALPTLPPGAEVLLAGMLTSVRYMNVKKPRNGNSRYVRCKLEDFTGQAECMMWPDEFVRYKDEFVDDRIIFAKGTVEQRGEPLVVFTRVFDVETARQEMMRGLILTLDLHRHEPQTVDGLASILRRAPGTCQVYLHVRDAAGKRARFKLGEDYRIDLKRLSLSELELLLGPGSVAFTNK